MNKVKCLNCGSEQEIENKNICYDELGSFTVCKKCGSSYDIKLKGEM